MTISAFPVLERGGSGLELTDPGMTLRDYFAAQAIGPLLQQIETYPDENWRLGIAIDAYAMADAMLAVRADAQRRLGDITTIRARGAQGESND